MRDEQLKSDVVIVGAGPVGIAAAAHLIERGLQPLILEKGPEAGHAMLKWGHVQVFTPWEHVTDRAVCALLEPTGWTHPDFDLLPTGRDIVAHYLAPAAALPELKNRILYGATVTGISKRGMSKSTSGERDTTPFRIHYGLDDGARRIIEARAVIDASGTWFAPNPIGLDGLPVPGETELADFIAYGIPDISGAEKAHYRNKSTLVLGGGHSAINVVLDLLRLREGDKDTRILWGLRRNNIDKLLGGGLNDDLPARGALGLAAREAIESGALELLAPLAVERLERSGDRVGVEAELDGTETRFETDRIVVSTGFRPDLDILREVRLDLDDVVEAPTRLAPMIDPNLHSCGTVPPHGVDELSHEDRNIFIVGMKSYGRAPTFLMKTGYEQVRSIADELAGRHEAARRIELVLPETGVCSGPAPDAAAAGTGTCCAPKVAKCC